MSEGSMHAEPSSSAPNVTPTFWEIQTGESMLDWLRQFGQGAMDAFRREICATRREARVESPADNIPPIETTNMRRGRPSASVE
jgi:hypothetical protein